MYKKLCYVLLFSWVALLSCDSSKRNQPVAPSGASSTDSPKLIAFSLPGIPPENIQIDHEKREVRVIIPTNISTIYLPASITMTAGFTPIPIGDTSPYIFSLYAARRPVEFYKSGNVYNDTGGAPYQVIAVASGPLEITTPPASLSLETGSPLLLTVKNYYDDAVTDNQAIITNQRTGQQYTASLYPCYEDNAYCQGATVGAVLASFDTNIEYGTYDLQIRKTNQRQVRATGSLTVRRGLPMALHDLYNPPAPGTRNVKMGGLNLFEADHIQLVLTNQTGDVYTLTPTSYATDGKSLTVDLPTTIKPSQYAIQMKRQGELVASYSRMIISRDRSQPAIVSFNYTRINQDPTIPLTMERGKRQLVTFVISSGIATARLKFISVDAGQPARFVDVDTPSAYLMAGPDGGVPTFTIPSTIPIGKYRVVLQHLMTDQQIVEGEPFERLVAVQ